MADIYGPNPSPDCLEEMARGIISIAHSTIRTAVDEMRILDKVIYMARTVGLCVDYITPKPDRLTGTDTKLLGMHAKVLADLDASMEKLAGVRARFCSTREALDSIASIADDDSEELDITRREYSEVYDWFIDIIGRADDLEPRVKESYDLMERLYKEITGSTKVTTPN